MYYESCDWHAEPSASIQFIPQPPDQTQVPRRTTVAAQTAWSKKQKRDDMIRWMVCRSRQVPAVSERLRLPAWVAGVNEARGSISS